MAYNPYSLAAIPDVALAGPYPVFRVITPQMFSTTAGTGGDDTAAVDSAILAGNTLGAPIYGGGLVYKITSPLTNALDISKTCLNDMILNCTVCTTGPVHTITTTEADPNLQSLRHSSHPYVNVQWFGPTQTAGVDGILYLPISASGTPELAGTIMIGGGMVGFRDQLLLGNGVNFMKFSGMFFGNDDGIYGALGARSVFKIIGTTNAGERICVDNSSFINGACIIWDQVQAPDYDFYFSQCSVDNFQYILTGGASVPGTTSAGANLNFDSGHLEVNGANTGICININTACAFTNSKLVGNLGSIGSHPLFSVASTGSLLFQGNTVNDGSTLSVDYLISGVGSVIANSNRPIGNTQFPVSAISNNLVPTNTFPTSTSFTSNWSGSTATYSNSNLAPSTPAAVGSIAFTAGQTASFKTSCSPGDYLSAACWGQVSNTTGATLTVQILFTDIGGNIMPLSSTLTFAANTAYTKMTYVPNAMFVAPPGTTSVSMFITLSNTSGATANVCLPSVWIA
jgi:hypothetical protein